MGLERLVEAVDGLVAEDPGVLADGDLIVAAHRELARLEAVVTRAAAAFDASGAWQADGAHGAAAWLATRCGLRRGGARRRVRLGRALGQLPVCERAWLAGEVTGEHVATIAGVRNARTAEVLARDEPLLVANARRLRFEAFAKTVAYWDHHADPDGADDRDQRRRARRDVHLAQSFNGIWLGRLTLDPISGTIVSGALERIETELFHAEWAAARARLGRDPHHHELDRTPAQRRADALVEMAARAQSAPAGGRRPAPLFSVLVGYETLHGRICELAAGTVVAPAALLPWLDQAYVERAVFRLNGRVEISATARLFTGATRRAIELRDQHCTHPYCDQPLQHCQTDHIIPYTQHGPTTQTNGQLQCGYHNRLKHTRPPP